MKKGKETILQQDLKKLSELEKGVLPAPLFLIEHIGYHPAKMEVSTKYQSKFFGCFGFYKPISKPYHSL